MKCRERDGEDGPRLVQVLSIAMHHAGAVTFSVLLTLMLVCCASWVWLQCWRLAARERRREVMQTVKVEDSVVQIKRIMAKER